MVISSARLGGGATRAAAALLPIGAVGAAAGAIAGKIAFLRLLANAQQMGAAAQFAHPAGGGAQKAGGTFEPWWCQNASGGNSR